MKPWPRAAHELLLTRWRENVPVKFIARELKRTPEQVRARIAWLRAAKGEHGFEIRRRRRPRTEVDAITAQVPPGTGEVRCATVAPATIYDATGRAVAVLDPLTRARRPVAG